MFLYFYLHRYNLTSQKNCALKLRFCRINFVQCLEQKARLLIKTNIRDIEAMLYVSMYKCRLKTKLQM